ncbi:MAG: hypothetical protein ACREOO_30780 [bacterium]
MLHFPNSGQAQVQKQTAERLMVTRNRSAVKEQTAASQADGSGQ